MSEEAAKKVKIKESWLVKERKGKRRIGHGKEIARLGEGKNMVSMHCAFEKLRAFWYDWNIKVSGRWSSSMHQLRSDYKILGPY